MLVCIDYLDKDSWDYWIKPFTGFPQALEIMENHEKKFHAWKNHGI